MKEEQRYVYWNLNMDDSIMEKDKTQLIYNCSACGHESLTSSSKICPECSAIMVEKLSNKTAIDGRDICSGDIVKCDVVGVVNNEKIEGTITNASGQWRFETQYFAAPVYDCDNIEIIKGIIPEGQYLDKEFLDSMQKKI